MFIRPFPALSRPAEVDDWDIPVQYAPRSHAPARLAATCDQTPLIWRELADSPSRVAIARRFVEECACPAHGQAALAVVRLLLSELVVSCQATGPVTVSLECLVTEMRMEVSCPSWREVVPDAHERLRVLLIAKVSRRWGVTRDGQARTSWATVPTGARPV